MPRILDGINIWSGCDVPIGAALTNCTELAFRKRKLKFHYPVVFQGMEFADAETAYQHHKTGDLEHDINLMVFIIKAKLEQHPQLKREIDKLGGKEWLEKCSHIVGVRNSRWEGTGLNSAFIFALTCAYVQVSLEEESCNSVLTP